jgi:hypothetical protein
MRTISLCALPLGFLLSAAPAAEPIRPNVLLILADDMGFSESAASSPS